jgi:DNA-3-methyladenine glycosylase II
MPISYWNEAKKHLILNDKILGKIISHYHGEMLTVRGDAFYTLARSIIGQQISVKAAYTIWGRLEAQLVTITPKSALKISETTLRECGLSAQKVRYLHGLAEHFIENDTHIKNWTNLSDEEILGELTALNGIGRWTAEMFMIFHLARPDILPLADIGLQKAIFRNYNNEQKMTLAEIFELSKVWKPYRSVATWYLWRSLDPIPVAY